MADLIDEQGYRANVGIVLMHDDGRVFLGRRSGGRGWQFPQGGIHAGESPQQALYRELREEIGLWPEDVRLAGATSGWLRYRLPPRFVRRDQSPVCIGQKQRWFLLRPSRADLAFRFDHTSLPEFDRWRWAEFWEPLREVIQFKRGVYRRALHELGRIAFGDELPPYPDWWSSVVPEAAASPPLGERAREPRRRRVRRRSAARSGG
jgi:putative (di)nucleoside polyphosphate hydrolase